MDLRNDGKIIDEFYAYIRRDSSVCVGAKGALAKDNIRVMVLEQFDDEKNSQEILNFAYNFIREYRESKDGLHSMVFIFKEPVMTNEAAFEEMLWGSLQSLSDLDAARYGYDKRVSADPSSPTFSFSLMEEAFFIIALHPSSSRMARRFTYPALVFNPHAQFEEMKKKGTYQKVKKVNRERDIKLSGSINPMLKDFGESSEIFQYSGAQHNADWECPFKINHQNNERN
ncbi:MAG: guanitoxin biosynthesis heme-dependent pre-guanitoxin N-hydroxylase GntA [Ginsengibacter sp.]